MKISYIFRSRKHGKDKINEISRLGCKLTILFVVVVRVDVDVDNISSTAAAKFGAFFAYNKKDG